MADAKVDGLSVEDAINVIKQKHFTELTANDIAFLRARRDYLSEADQRIFIDGEDPVEVLSEGGRALTREERIILENMPLQERQHLMQKARDAAAAAEAGVLAPQTAEQRTEAQEKAAEERKAAFESLNEEAEAIEKQKEEDANKSPERVELENEARSLGVSFNSRTKDETLREKIEEKKGE